jgi:hypothetical protein
MGSWKMSAFPMFLFLGTGTPDLAAAACNWALADSGWEASNMAETVVLQGKVRKLSLPIIQGPPGADAPTLKRLRLPQGELAQVYDAPDGIRYLAVIELLPDSLRGNHYHRVKEELVYVIQGEVLLALADPVSGARDSISLEPGDLAIIPTGIAHALKTVRPGVALEFSPAGFDSSDIHRYPVI